MHTLLQTLCFRYKVCDVEYFLDRMLEYELQTYIDNIQYLNVNEWEQTRLLMYVTALVNSKKKLDVKNIIKFPWDSIKHDTNISNDDIARLKEQSKLIEEQLRGLLF